MFNLISKELKLAAHPTLFIFMLLGSFVMLPSYPYSVVLMFACLGPFISIFYARETNDSYYTALLPLKKSDAVKGKILMTVVAQIGQILISIPFSIYKIVNSLPKNPVGIESNVTYYGIAFIIFAVFNFIFFTQFYKSAFEVGKAFVIASIPTLLIMFAMEAISHIDKLSWMNSVESNQLLKQVPILILGIIVYIISIFMTYKISAKRFEKVDL